MFRFWLTLNFLYFSCGWGSVPLQHYWSAKCGGSSQKYSHSIPRQWPDYQGEYIFYAINCKFIKVYALYIRTENSESLKIIKILYWSFCSKHSETLRGTAHTVHIEFYADLFIAFFIHFFSRSLMGNFAALFCRMWFICSDLAI